MAKQTNNEKTTKKVSISSAKTQIESSSVVEIELSKIVVSRFEPQKRRRARFVKDDTLALGQSIKQNGLKQPIQVRPLKPLDFMPEAKFADYEIVFGERRFLASEMIGAKTIRCFVEDLTDAQVLELQYEENHRRQENSPLDDAFLFKFLIDTENYDEQKLADKFNKKLKTVKETLKLNQLIAPAVELFETDKLPLKHAIYLAKFDDAAQKEILDEKMIWRWNDENDGIAPFEDFKDEIESNIVRKLSDAPFDPEDTRLHLKGLKCSECANNTAFEQVLFPEFADAARCTDKKCFEFKSNVHFNIKRDEIALKSKSAKPIDEAAKDVPLVTTKGYADDVPFKEKVLTSAKILPKPECEDSTLALAVGGNEKGQEVYVCLKKECPVHNPKKPIPADDKSTAADLQKTEIKFLEKVQKETRRKIFTQTIKFFNKEAFWLFDDLICDLICTLIGDCGYDTYAELHHIFNDKKMPKNYGEREAIADWVKTLTKEKQSQILFLLTFRTEGYYKNSSVAKLESIAVNYTKSNYKTIEAEAILELAPDEFKDIAENYLDVVKRGEKAEIPRFWTKSEDGAESDFIL